jgi:hypothetical protein
LLRKYLPLPPGPGTGRSRRYSILDAVRIAVVAELGRFGINIGTAAKAAELIGEPVDEPNQVLVMGPSTWPIGSKPPDLLPLLIFTYETVEELQTFIAEQFPVSFMFVDISAVAARVVSRLGGDVPNQDAAIPTPPAPTKKLRKTASR